MKTFRHTDVVAAVLALETGAAHAQTFPSKPVRLIVPYPPCGLTDIVARLVTGGLQPLLGEPVVVDNRPGAGTNIFQVLQRAPAADAGHYERLCPEDTVLYQLVQEHLDTFLDQVDAQTGVSFPSSSKTSSIGHSAFLAYGVRLREYGVFSCPPRQWRRLSCRASIIGANRSQP